jgi:hypothetical protein
MRRFRDRQSMTVFQGRELPRLLGMIGALLVLAMLIYRARDANAWRFLTGEQQQLAEVDADADALPPAAADAEQAVPAEENPADAEATPALDEDPEERSGIEDEFQAVTDRSPIVREEMFAYRRLLRWTEESKLPDMLRRAKRVRYGDLIVDPAAHRGELIKVRLHVIQLLKVQAPDNLLNIDTYYQAVGWNDDSQAWFYFCIFVDLPQGMPIGNRIEQLGTFVGYLLKTTNYKDGQGKPSEAPVLIGRMQWNPLPPSKAREVEWSTTWIVFAVAAGWFLLRFIMRLPMLRGRFGKKRTSLIGSLAGNQSSAEPVETVENWLDRVESTSDSEAINPPAQHESNGSSPNHFIDHPPDPRLDRPEDRGG